MILLSHPTGNEFARNALQAFEDAGQLSEFVTSIACYEGNIWSKLAHTKIGAPLSRRAYDPHLQCKTTQNPMRDLGRMLAPKLGLHFLTQHEKGLCCVDQVYQAQDRLVASIIGKGKHASMRAVYCYEDGALHSFQAAKQLDLARIYDLPIGYWRAARRIQTEEAQLLPEWASTMPALIDGDKKLQRKDEEIALATHIIVASSFTANTLHEYTQDYPQPFIVPYGCPPAANEIAPSANNKEPLKVLFVGGLSQRKGVHYLLEAANKLDKAISLTFIGRKPCNTCKPLNDALSRYRWIETLPHREILTTIREHDILVFPSIFEGFGLVITEALSQGVPVITTPNTCGPDILSNGKDGFIVPIRDANAIAEKLELIHQDRDRLNQMKLAALEKAKTITWQGYREQLIDAVSPAVKA